MRRAERIMIWILPIIAFGVFLSYATLSPRASTAAIVSAGAGILLFTAVGLRMIRSMLGFFVVPMYNRHDELIGERTKYHMHPRRKIFFRSLVMQVVAVFVVYLIFCAVNGYSGTVFQKYSTIFMQQNAYGIGLLAHNAASEIALLPVISKLITFCDITLSIDAGIMNLIAFILNSLIVSFGCVMFYEVLLLDNDRTISSNALFTLFISPAILFLLMSLSGASLLFLLSLLFFYFMKTSRPLIGLFFMVEAIILNILALVLVIPFVLLSIKLIVKNRKNKKLLAFSVTALSVGIIGVGGLIALIGSGVVNSHAVSLMYPDGFRWYFEGMTAAILRWNASTSSALAMFFAIGAQSAALLLAVLCAHRVDFSIGMFTLGWLALVPMAFEDPSMAVYAVCVCPSIPIMLSVSAKRRTTRLVLWAFMLIVFVTFTSTVFAHRLV